MNMRELMKAIVLLLLLVKIGYADELLTLYDYLRVLPHFDFPAGIPHGTWDFDEWPGVDHEKVYRKDNPFQGMNNMMINLKKTHFDSDDHLGYLTPPETLDAHGFSNIRSFLEETFPSQPAREITILTVTAHPDDESIDLAGILGWASSKGYKTVAVCVTSGANSQRLVDEKEIEEKNLEYNAFGIDNKGEYRVERDLYGEEREASFSTACGILGVTRSFLLQVPGGELVGRKVTYFGEISGLDYERTFGKKGRFRATIKDALKEMISEVKPNILFTHGSNGGYGHPMHLIVNELVTEVIKENSSRIILFYSTPEMNASDKITHYLNLREEGRTYQSMKEKAFKAHDYVANATGNYDIPWDPIWNQQGILIKDYGWTPTGYPPPYEFYSLQ